MAKKTTLILNAGKGSKSELLPHRYALTKITKGDPSERSINGYAKRTPFTLGPRS